MKSTGIIRKVDELGRVVIPIELRKTMSIEEGSPLEIFVKGNEIILKKANKVFCTNCGQILDCEDKFCKNCGKEQ